ncbi:MAG: SDR family NAD(P)-dependent oxidoreductase [Candidatus Promineifilaceae bacterium]|nr:SDR family NAD(P)-dependent oxidoreductase [Candidatus Promineifilaceae bacterium]
MAPTIIVTGASRGLGAAIATEAAALGARVVLSARSVARLEAQARDIRQNGGAALVAPGDVSRLEDCQAIVYRTAERFGAIDALVNNAGMIEPLAPLAETPPSAWRHHLDVNVLGPMMLTQAALPYLRQRQGRVIHVSSGAAEYGRAGWAAYCIGKGALNQFNRVLAEEEPALTTIAVRPGVVDTDMQATIREEGAAGMTKADHERFIRFQEKDQLLDPTIPGRVLAYLALRAPAEWSGEFLSWDDEKVQALTEEG